MVIFPLNYLLIFTAGVMLSRSVKVVLYAISKRSFAPARCVILVSVKELGTLATMKFRISCLLMSYRRTRRPKYKKNMIFPLVLYWWYTWSVTPREEHRLRMSDRGC